MPDKNFAALDIGTNSFHLVIVRVNKDNTLTTLDREREVIRLGSQKGDELTHISEEEVSKGISVLKKFKKLTETYNAEIHAVATSAVREADNKNVFLDKVFNETGIKIEVINGHKEAEYIYKGVRKTFPLENKKLLCLDIGGGSTEYILGYNDKIIFGESIKIGAVRLSKKFFPGFILTKKGIQESSEYVEKLIRENKEINLDENYDMAVGASGTIMAVAGMINYRRSGSSIKSLNKFVFTKAEMEEVIREIFEKKTPEERTNIEGMEYKRADIIPAGLIVLQKSFKLFNINEMTISEYALREGVVLSMLEKVKHNPNSISV